MAVPSAIPGAAPPRSAQSTSQRRKVRLSPATAHPPNPESDPCEAPLRSRNRDFPGFDGGVWDRLTMLSHAFNVEFDRAANLLLRIFSRLARCNAARQVRYIGRPVFRPVFVNNGIFFHSFCSSNPACRNTLLSVLGWTVSPRCPETVTVPGFVAC